MREAMRKQIVWLVILSLVLGICLPACSGLQVEAAGKPKLSKSRLTMYVGDTKTLQVKNSKGKIKWSSSKKSVASVSSKGKVKGKKAGTARITATVKGKKLTCKVTVKNRSPKLSKTSAVLMPGSTLALKLNYAKGTVKWSTSDKKVAEVTKKGKVTAKAVGTAKITATFKKKKYSCRIQVIKAGTKLLDITFDNAAIEQQNNSSTGQLEKVLSTRDEVILVSGKVIHPQTALTGITYQLYDSEKTLLSQGSLAKQDAWSVNLKPAVGVNTFVITASEEAGTQVSRTLTIVRYSDRITLSEQVVSGDEAESVDFSENAYDITRKEAQQSNDPDTVTVILEKDSELVEKLQSGEVKKDDTYLLPSSEELPTGFSGVVVSWGEPKDSLLDPEQYVEVVFEEPDLEDLFEGDGCIDFGGGVNPDDPVAFVMVPDGSEVSAVTEQGERVYRAGSDEYDSQVLPNGVSDFFKPGITVSGKGAVTVKLNLADVLLFDQDKKKKTTTDQIKLKGSIEFSDISFDGNMAWKDQGLQILPQQIKVDLSYKSKVDVALEGGGTADFKKLVQDANDKFQNKVKMAGIELSGIDMSDKLMLGLIGLNFITPPSTYTIHEAATTTKLTMAPMYFLAVYLDVSGSITSKVTVAFQDETYKESGFNLYNTKANNIQWGNSALYTETKELAGGYRISTYENKRKSKTEYKDPEPKLIVEGKVEAKAGIGVGAMGGVMVFGMIPGDFYGECKGEVDVDVDGKLTVTWKTNNQTIADPSLRVSGKFKTFFAVGADLKFAVKVLSRHFKSASVGAGLEYSKSKEFPIFDLQLDYPTFTLKGTLYDLTDKTVKDHPVLQNAELYLYDKEKLPEGKEITAELLESSQEDFKGMSDGEGAYQIEGMGRRSYAVLIKTAGYQKLVDTVTFSGSDITKDYYVEPIREKNWLNVCKPYQYTQIYGEYLGDGNGTMTISGVKYDAGFYLNNGNQGTGGSSDALWNLQGKYSSLKVRIGHLDDTQLLSAQLFIYLDGAEDPSQTIDLDCQDVSRVYTIDLNHAESARFSLKKTQWDNWATSSFGFLEGVWYGENGAEGTVNFKDPFEGVDWNADFMSVCAPYKGISCTTYTGDPENTFTMSGITYDTGFKLTTQSVMSAWGRSAAMFHTDGRFSKLKVRIGHVDTTSSISSELYVYLDGEAEPSQTIPLDAKDVARVQTIELNYAKGVKLVIRNDHDNWSTTAFGFVEGEWVK